MELTAKVKQKALQAGFDLVGITDAAPIDSQQIKYMQQWLEAGSAGQMAYLHKNFQKRFDPGKLLIDAKSVICVGLNYAQPKQKDLLENVPLGKVASYAQYEDYHNFIKKNLRQIAEFLARQTTDEFKFKICVDSVPIAEKALAQRAGLGFIGKNHLLINPQLGCKILLGEIITTLKLQSDKPMKNSCAQCDKCLRACPTGALTSDGRFDANKCISYLTIEYKDDIEPGLAEKIGDRLFGCDECICACPYQNTAPSCKNKSFKLYFNRANLDMDEILSLTEDEFNERFADSPIKRLGLERLKRNARICLSNLAKG